MDREKTTEESWCQRPLWTEQAIAFPPQTRALTQSLMSEIRDVDVHVLTCIGGPACFKEGWVSRHHILRWRVYDSLQKDVFFGRAVKQRSGLTHKVKTNCRIMASHTTIITCQASYSRRGAPARYGQAIIRVARAKSGKIIRAKVEFTGKGKGKINWSRTVAR